MPLFICRFYLFCYSYSYFLNSSSSFLSYFSFNAYFIGDSAKLGFSGYLLSVLYVWFGSFKPLNCFGELSITFYSSYYEAFFLFYSMSVIGSSFYITSIVWFNWFQLLYTLDFIILSIVINSSSLSLSLFILYIISSRVLFLNTWSSIGLDRYGFFLVSSFYYKWEYWELLLWRIWATENC